MKIDRDMIQDPQIYEIMYFTPVEVGDERYINKLYFQTDIYNRAWPVTMVDRMQTQTEQLKHCELGILSFDEPFKRRHREAVLFHLKMALAYLDARQARIAMKLCEVCLPATRSAEPRIQYDPEADFDFLRVLTLSVLACAARRVKFFKKAVDALSEAKSLCLGNGEGGVTHPLMTAITLLNLSAVLGEIDHDEHGLRWGLEALAMMYNLFSTLEMPETVQAYYLVLACHNAALLNVKMERWADAVELFNEGIEFTKVLGEHDDGLRRKLIAIGAQAKHVPEGFLIEAVNALNGWGEERGVWNLSFWDFSIAEIEEEIRVLQNTSTLRKLIIEHSDDDRRYPAEVEDVHLCRLMMAVCSCQSLEQISISGIEFNPRKVWLRIKKRGFLETSWYASALNFSNMLDNAKKPDTGHYADLLKGLNHFSKKLVMILLTLGNESEGIDLSNNGINRVSATALVQALRWPERPEGKRYVKEVILRSNEIDATTAQTLAKIWDPVPAADGLPSHQERQGVVSLDVSHNTNIGDEGFLALTAGLSRYNLFKALKADSIGLGSQGCLSVDALLSTRLEHLTLSNNPIGNDGAAVICATASKCDQLRTLELDNCGITSKGAKPLSDLLRHHSAIKTISVAHNKLQDVGIIEFCTGAAESSCLQSVNLAYNGMEREDAAEAVAEMMRTCETLLILNLSGNRLDSRAPPQIGSAIEHSHILTMYLEDMGFTADSIDDFLDHGAAETQDLQVMVLNGNKLGDEGLAIIAECLSIGLTDLSISRCGLTSECQATLLNLVSLSPNLRSLDLSHNDLGPSGAVDMVTWITQNDKDSYALRSLELSGCNLGDEGFRLLIPLLGSLNYLGLRENGITSAGLEVVMKSNQYIRLQVLDLEGNFIDESGVHTLTERFQKEHKRSLWNPKLLTSMIDTVILRDNGLPTALQASTEAYLKIHNPLMTVVW